MKTTDQSEEALLRSKCVTASGTDYLHLRRRFCFRSEDTPTLGTRLYLYSKDGCHLCDGLKASVHPWSHVYIMFSSPSAGARSQSFPV